MGSPPINSTDAGHWGKPKPTIGERFPPPQMQAACASPPRAAPRSPAAAARSPRSVLRPPRIEAAWRRCEAAQRCPSRLVAFQAARGCPKPPRNVPRPPTAAPKPPGTVVKALGAVQARSGPRYPPVRLPPWSNLQNANLVHRHVIFGIPRGVGYEGPGLRVSLEAASNRLSEEVLRATRARMLTGNTNTPICIS